MKFWAGIAISFIYPLDLKLNDTLPDSDFRIAFGYRKSYGMKTPSVRMINSCRSRKCIDVDTLVINGLVCIAWVVDNTVFSNMNGSGENINTVSRIVEWCSPQYGLIRTE